MGLDKSVKVEETQQKNNFFEDKKSENLQENKEKTEVLVSPVKKDNKSDVFEDDNKQNNFDSDDDPFADCISEEQKVLEDKPYSGKNNNKEAFEEELFDEPSLEKIKVP